MAGKKTAPLDARSADKLLDLLSSDNDFRRSFKKDPRAAMQKAKIGVGADPALMASVAACCQVTRIAPKADVIKARVTAVQLYRHIDTMKWIRFLSRNTLGKMDPFWSILLLVGGSSIATFGQLLRLLAANRRVSERNHANSSGPNGQVLFRSRL